MWYERYQTPRKINMQDTKLKTDVREITVRTTTDVRDIKLNITLYMWDTKGSRTIYEDIKVRDTKDTNDGALSRMSMLIR